MAKSWVFPIGSAAVLGALVALGLHMRARLARLCRIRQARIVTEIPDALLQDFQGVLLRLQAAAEQVPAELPARKAMDEALDQADMVLSRASDTIGRARMVNNATGEFPPAGPEKPEGGLPDR